MAVQFRRYCNMAVPFWRYCNMAFLFRQSREREITLVFCETKHKMNLSGSRTPDFLNTSAFPRTFLLFLKASLCFRTAEVSDSTTTTTSDVCKHHITATIYTKKAVYTDNYICTTHTHRYLRDRQIQSELIPNKVSKDYTVYTTPGREKPGK